MRFSLSKESVGYHQVKSYREVQNFLPLLIPTTIPKTSMNRLETCACSTYMPIKISYKKFLTTRYSSNEAILVFPELSLSTLVEAYLGGIRTNYVQDHITNDKLD